MFTRSRKKSVATVVLHNIKDMLTTEHQGQGDGQETVPSGTGDQGNAPEVRITTNGSQKQQSGCEESGTVEKMPAETSTDDKSSTENGPPDHAYAAEGRVLRKKRKSTASDVASSTCTVCGVTVRPSELQSHFDWEVDKLDNMLRLDGTRHREQKKPSTPSTSAKRKRDSARNEDDDEDIPLDPQERQKEFERVKNKRQERLYSRLRKNMRANLDEGAGPSTSTASDDDSTTCPICQIVLTGTAEERNSHAEACLVARSFSGAAEEDEDVDIEGDGFEEYTWCGQTRVRATSLLETGYRGLGYEVGQQSTDVDTELNIESDDDSTEFGPPQFGEADIIPCASEEMDEQTQTLRNAVLEGSQERVPPLHQEDPSININNNDVTSSEEQNRPEAPAESSSSDTKTSFHGNPLYPGQSRTVIQSLKAKIKELEEMVNKQNSVRCLICMDPYSKPTVSVQCWHVHCKECWLRTLGAKKLCPQCNMITSPSQLRQIYL